MTRSESILDALEILGTATTTEIKEATGIPYWAVFHHLKKLSKYSMVTELGTVGHRKEHRWRLTA